MQYGKLKSETANQLKLPSQPNSLFLQMPINNRYPSKTKSDILVSTSIKNKLEGTHRSQKIAVKHSSKTDELAHLQKITTVPGK